MSFWTELKRRSVYKVAVAYGVVAWLLIQIATQVFPFLQIPDWAIRLVIVLVALGFPLALIFAWAFDLTPEGLKRTSAERTDSPPAPGRAWIYIVVLGVLISLGLFFAGRYSAWDRGSKTSSAAAAAELKSVAVLPFVNLSSDPANDYFSDGITEEILNAISHLPDLKVASRTSSFAYKGKNEDVAGIARTLRVANILEGSVQRSGERVRVTAQLIDASNGFHLWSEKYDREAKDLFALEDEIAQSIAGALKLKLTGQKEVARGGTENVESHEAYLKALQVREDSHDEALRWVERAIALDPKFAAAYAFKARILSRLAFSSTKSEDYDRYIVEGEEAAKRAVELAPNLADAYSALGEMARRRGEDNSALANFDRATKLKPADPDAWQGLGMAIGWKDPATALRYLRKAKELGGTSRYLDRQIAYGLDGIGRVDEAHELLEKAHAAHPDFVAVTLDLGRYELWVRGRPDRALEFFIEAWRQEPSFVDAQVPIAFYPALIYAVSDHLPQVETWLARERAIELNSPAVLATEILLAGIRGDRETFRTLEKRLPEQKPGGNPVELLLAGDTAILANDFEVAARLLAQVLDDSFFKGAARKSARFRRAQMQLAYALDRLGRQAEAAQLLEAASQGLAEMPRFGLLNRLLHPINGLFYTDAEIYALRGEKEKAVAALDAMLALPDDGFIPLGSLPVPVEDSPLLESLRDTPGFANFRKEAARRRAVAHERVAATRKRLGLVED